MLLFRSLLLGMLGACFLLLATFEPPTVNIIAPASPPVIAMPSATATLIDVAPGVKDVFSLVRLEPGEHVVAVDDARVANDLAAGAAIASRTGGRDFVDLAVEGPAGPRRMLLLMH